MGRYITRMGAMETDTGTEKEIKEPLEEKQHNDDEVVEEKNKKTEANMFQRVKNRFSTRSKKLDKDVDLEKTTEKVKDEKQLNENGELSDKEVELRKYTKGENQDNDTYTGKPNDEGEKEENKGNVVDDKNNPKKETNVFVRVKER